MCPQQEKEALDDLSTELELADEDDPVLYKVGESFFSLRHSRAMNRLQSDLESVESQIEATSTQAHQCETTMKELKVILYAKFGKAINLDE
ncbi:hypothetical protein JAAARDRAFT_328560 [Jaapia argillacea MUCL 33604]|uniref:Prefoldin subunit 4 n=1 Tax=Jaapia argillacea MUCL 33604 TaxID=933084 RepID=A0A067PZG1_9AGAM|nr:hypothetical protein JAAARDRAFT_328560 [Jaapia argillacea MUCL 33604]